MPIINQPDARILCERLLPALDLLLSSAVSAGGDLCAVERSLETALQSVRRQLVCASLEATQSACGDEFFCPGCKSRLTGWGRYPRIVVTSQGEGSLNVKRLRCRKCRSNYSPILTRNDLESTQYTIGARQAIAVEAAEAPFGRASERLRHLGIAISASEVDQIAREVGNWRKDEEEAVRSFLVLKGRDLALPLHDTRPWNRFGKATAAVVSVDGAKVRSNRYDENDGDKGLQWFEVRVGVVTLVAEAAPKICIGGVLDPDKLFETLWSQSRQILGERDRIVFTGDGALWIWERARHWFPKAIQVLDIYHAGEHVASAARACWGEGFPETKRWATEARDLLLQERGVESILKRLTQELRKGSVADKEGLLVQIRYLWKNRHRMNYAWLKSQDLPIGSGVMESMIKQTSTYRLCQSGMMWTKSGADTMLRLRAACLSRSLDFTVNRQHQIAKARLNRYAKAA
jgi:hypothetical protein